MKRSIIVLLVVLGLLFGAAPASAQIYWYAINGNLFAAGPIMLPDGTAAAPAMAFGGASSTGIFRNGTAITISAAGTARWSFDGNSIQSASDGTGIIGATTTARPGAINIGGRTVTVNTQPALNMAETWNEGSTTFAGIRYTITDTASASTSLPFQILCGAAGTTNCFSVSKAGSVSTAGINSTGSLSLGGNVYLSGLSAGAITFRNASLDGFTTLNLGPTTGNTASGSTTIGHVVTTINMATATGTGTGTITSANTALPAASLIEFVTCRVSPALAGAGLTTFSLGDGTDADRWGTTLAITLDTTIGVANYTVTAPAYQVAAGSLVLTAAAGVFSTGILTCTTHYKKPIVIGS